MIKKTENENEMMRNYNCTHSEDDTQHYEHIIDLPFTPK